MARGKFITFEGGEGSGKSTQIKRLSAFLTEKEATHIITREPGGTPAGEAIRELLVRGAVDKFSPETEALLNYAARAEHLRQVIEPNLSEGRWVLCDRFNDSTFAYQGQSVALDFLEHLDKAIVGDSQPDLTFILDLEPQAGLARAGKRLSEASEPSSEDRFEKKGIEYHRKLRDVFLKRAGQDKTRYHVIDASQPVEIVSKKICDIALNQLMK